MHLRFLKLFSCFLPLSLSSPVFSQETVYEGFDYADDTPLAGLNGGTGFDSAWVTDNGTGPELFVNAGAGPNDNGLSAANLLTTGGHIDRSIRTNFTTSSRTLSPASVSALTADGTTMWGSFLYRDGVGDGNNADSSFAFGSTKLGLSNNHVLSAPGYAVGVTIGERTVYTEAVYYENATAPTYPATASSTLTDSDILDTTSLFVFSVEWNADGTDDVLSFYRVTNVNAPLPLPFSTQSFDFDAATQASFNLISLVETQGGEFDEIRLGTTLASVTPAGSSNEPSIVASDDLITIDDSTSLSIYFDPTADTALLTTPAGDLSLFTLDDGSTNGDSVAGDGIVIYPDSPPSSFTYVVTTTKTGENPLVASAEVLVADPSAVPSNAFSSVILADAPLFYYRFEEEAGAGLLTDVSGNGYHTNDIVGALGQGSAPSPGGMQNAGYCADNVGIKVTSATTDISTAYTLVAVLNSDNIQNLNENIFSMADGTGTGRSIFGMTGGAFHTFTGGADLQIPVTTTPSSQTSFLVHFVFEPDEVNTAAEGFVSGEIRLYIDGSLEGSVTIDTEINEGEWVLASHKLRNFNYFEGFLDETAVFQSALSEARIAAHAAAFLAAADPLLGYVSDSAVVSTGEAVTLEWKISDQATSVEVDGVVQTISGGGIYSTVVNPANTTTYTIEVFFSGGSVTSSVDVSVVGPPMITSISADSSVPPNITIEFTGLPSSSYDIKASSDLEDGFTIPIETVMTDGTGFGTITFPGFGDAEFYRIEYD